MIFKITTITYCNIWQVQMGIIIRSSWIADALLKWSYACHSAVKPGSSNALTVIYLIWFDHCIEKRHIARTEQILPQPRAYRSTHAPKVHLPTSARAAALLWKSKVLFFLPRICIQHAMHRCCFRGWRYNSVSRAEGMRELYCHHPVYYHRADISEIRWVDCFIIFNTMEKCAFQLNMARGRCLYQEDRAQFRILIQK